MLDQRVLDVITYWLDNKHGAGFLSVDGSTAHQDGTISTDEFTASRKPVDLTARIRAHSSLPVWWSEWYVIPKAGAAWTDAHKAAVVANGLADLVTSGGAAALLWQPQGDLKGCSVACVWTDTRQPGGGGPTLLAGLWPSLAQWLAAPGHQRVVAAPATVEAFAGGSLLLVVNTGAQPETATIQGITLRLDPYGVVVRPGSPVQPN